MEYLKAINSISNNNNITTIKLITNKQTKQIRIPYTIIKHPKGITYNYSLSIFDYCQLNNINTYKYLKGASWDCL